MSSNMCDERTPGFESNLETKRTFLLVQVHLCRFVCTLKSSLETSLCYFESMEGLQMNLECRGSGKFDRAFVASPLVDSAMMRKFMFCPVRSRGKSS